jgi:uncharacterized protein (TIGR03437 family)
MSFSKNPIICGVFFLCAGMAYGQTPAILPGGVLNGASNDKTQTFVAPGSLISIYGNNLAFASDSATSIPLPTSLSSASVTINNITCPLTAVIHGGSYDQINAQVPWELIPVAAPGTANVSVVVLLNGVASAPYTEQVVPAAPGIFTFGSGVGQALVFNNADYTTAAPTNSGLPYNPHPAKIGDPYGVFLYATGLGDVNQEPADGGIPPAGVLVNTLATPTVLVGGVPAQVLFSGLTPYVGVYQINITLAPGTPAGNTVSLQISMNGITTRGDVTMAVTQ